MNEFERIDATSQSKREREGDGLPVDVVARVAALVPELGYVEDATQYDDKGGVNYTTKFH